VQDAQSKRIAGKFYPQNWVSHILSKEDDRQNPAGMKKSDSKTGLARDDEGEKDAQGGGRRRAQRGEATGEKNSVKTSRSGARNQSEAAATNSSSETTSHREPVQVPTGSPDDSTPTPSGAENPRRRVKSNKVAPQPTETRPQGQKATNAAAAATKANPKSQADNDIDSGVEETEDNAAFSPTGTASTDIPLPDDGDDHHRSHDQQPGGRRKVGGGATGYKQGGAYRNTVSKVRKTGEVCSV
jgi:hypothetical protein